MIHEFGYNDFLFLLQGAQQTLLLSLIAFIGGGIGGMVIALSRTQGPKLLQWVSSVYIGIFQGTPLLLQLFITYFGLALLSIQINVWVAVAVGLTLHSSAFLGEIWRGCIQAVPRGQTEAAEALGLDWWSRMSDIVLPQAFKISLPATVGFLVALIKGTSLAAIIGFTELARAGQLISNITFQPLIVYACVGAIYFVICWPLTILSLRMEDRMTTGR